MIKIPFDQIIDKMDFLPKYLYKYLPKKWNKIGDILILRIDKNLYKYKKKIAEIYARVLKCRSVLEETGGIYGTYRKPKVRCIYGDRNTETIHKEHSIRYKLDPMKIMFSPGNMYERMRMSKEIKDGEIVVDLFAGIGYFTIPIAVYSNVDSIYACEINPDAFDYLRQNISLNHVTDIVNPILGDNRKVTPKGVADRVIMGYIKDTYRYLPVAFSALRDGKGVINYHEICPEEIFPDGIINRIKKISKIFDKDINVIKYRVVKSYAPHVNHVVVDVEVR